MSALKLVQSNLTGKTDAELIAMGHVVKTQKDENGRIVSAAITEELIARNPSIMPAVDAWSADLDTEADLLDVIVEALAA